MGRDLRFTRFNSGHSFFPWLVPDDSGRPDALWEGFGQWTMNPRLF